MMVLVFIKTFQFRHPDTSANVFTAMYAFCVLIFFESISIYITNYNWKIAFHAICGVFYLSFIIHLSIENYFYGAIRVSYKTTIPILFENFCEKSRHPFRLGMMVVFFIINFILVTILFIRTVKSEKEITSLSTPILLLCSANVALYLTQYLFRKFYEISQDVDSGQCCNKSFFEFWIDKNLFEFWIYWAKFLGLKLNVKNCLNYQYLEPTSCFHQTHGTKVKN